MSTYIALLRAINLGGRAKVPMVTLRQILAALAFDNVNTYIQSGNVVFSSEKAPVVSVIEKALMEAFGFPVPVMLSTADEWNFLVTANPFVGEKKDLATLHVTFLADEPDSELVSQMVIPQGSREELEVKGKYVYVHCPDGYGRAKINNAFMERKLGLPATSRNWRTVLALHQLVADIK